MERAIIFTQTENGATVWQDKPVWLAPLLDQSAIQLSLHLLRRHGVRQAAIQVTYPDSPVCGALNDIRPSGMDVTYTTQPVTEADGPLLMLRAGMVTDADLSALCLQHGMSGAAVTLAVGKKYTGQPVAVDVEGGVMDVASDIHCSDKPRLMSLGIMAVSASALRTRPLTAGDDGEWLRALLKTDTDIRAFEMSGYWHGLTTVQDYREIQLDLLHGRVGLPVDGRRRGSAIIARASQVSPDVRVTGRCYVGPFATVGRGTVLGAGTIIGPGARVGRNVRMENALLCENAAIGSDAMLRNVMVLPRPADGGLPAMSSFFAPNTSNGS